MARFFFNLIFCLLSLNIHAEGYMRPDESIAKIVEAGDAPRFRINRQRSFALELFYSSTPSIAYLSQAKIKLAGIQFFPNNLTEVDSTLLNEIKVIDLSNKKIKQLKTIHYKHLGGPIFSENGKSIAYSVAQDHCLELWTANLSKATNKKIPNICLNGIMGRGYSWVDDNHLLVRLAAKPSQAPMGDEIPLGPTIRESKGNKAQNRTFQNLLKSKNDELIFETYTNVQLAVVNVTNGAIKKVGPPGIINSYSLSPDKQYVLIHRINRPFSYVVPFELFPSQIEVLNLDGKFVQAVVKRPVQDHLPIGGVPQGIRAVSWIPSLKSSLSMTEALDQGDWKVKAEYRDLVSFAKIDKNQYSKLKQHFKLKNRYSGINWFEDGKRAILWDYERDQKRARAELVDFSNGMSIRQLWDFGVNDSYHLPGEIVESYNSFGESVIKPLNQNKREWIFLDGEGASPEGERPFLRKMAIDNGESLELFRSSKDSYERFVLFLDDSFTHFLTSFQTSSIAPKIYKRSLKEQNLKELFWSYDEPAEIFSKIKSEILTYKRKDGVELSGILYYPLDYEVGKKYPVVIRAYPQQFSNAEEAGQVRGSSSKFIRPFRADPKYFTLKGYVLLDRAQMPIVGHPDNMNDTFLDQIEMNAIAAIKAINEKGILDGDRVAVIGHSYGAFMVANLLTHTDLFKTGIARSGAYNRTLTPYGFQNERRTFWEAKETYLDVSPFVTANKNKHPILLIHGEDDANSGTFTMQSERYFSALEGNGGIARLVIMPKEGHSYAAKESVLHLLWEQLAWLDRYLKN